MMKTLAAVGTLALAAVAPASESTAVIALGRCDRDSEALVGGVRALRDAMSKLPGANVSTERETGGVQAGSLADAQRLLEKAWLDHAQGQLHEAEQALITALSILEAVPASSERWKTQESATLLLGQVQLWEGKRTEATKAVEHVLAIEEPEFQPSSRDFMPEFRRFAAQVRRRLKRTATLGVTTRPEGETVFINGRNFKTPFLRAVVPGTYRIEPTGSRLAAPITVEVSTSASIVVDEATAFFPTLGPCAAAEVSSRDSRLAAMLRVGSKLGVSTLVGCWEERVGTTDERYLVAATVDLRSGKQAREGKVRLSPDGIPADVERLSSFILTGAPPLVEPVVNAAPAPAPTTAPVQATAPKPSGIAPEAQVTAGSPPTGVSRLKVAGWVACAIGVLAGAGAGYFAWSSGQQQAAANRLGDSAGVVPADQVGAAVQFQRTSATQKGIATILGIVGGAGVIVGAGMIVLAPTPQSSGTGVIARAQGTF